MLPFHYYIHITNSGAQIEHLCQTFRSNFNYKIFVIIITIYRIYLHIPHTHTYMQNTVHISWDKIIIFLASKKSDYLRSLNDKKIQREWEEKQLKLGDTSQIWKMIWSESKHVSTIQYLHTSDSMRKKAVCGNEWRIGGVCLIEKHRNS